MDVKIAYIGKDIELKDKIESILSALTDQLRYFPIAVEAMDAFRTEEFSLMLFDFYYPYENALNSFKVIKQNFPDIPAIVIFPEISIPKDLILQILKNEAFFYFFKPTLVIEEFFIFCSRAIAYYKLKRDNQSLIRELAYKEELEANIDPLTGLLTYEAFIKRMEAAAVKAQRNNDPISIILIEIYKMKDLKEIYGEKFLNDLALQISKILSQNLRGSDVKAYGGDGLFAVGIEGGDIACALHVIEKIKRLLGERKFVILDNELSLNINAGASSLIIKEVYDLHNLVNLAFNALNQAKSKGPNRVELLS